MVPASIGPPLVIDTLPPPVDAEARRAGRASGVDVVGHRDGRAAGDRHGARCAGRAVEFDPALASMRPTRTSLPRSVTFAPLPPLPSRPLALMVPPTRSAPVDAASVDGAGAGRWWRRCPRCYVARQRDAGAMHDHGLPRRVHGGLVVGRAERDGARRGDLDGAREPGRRPGRVDAARDGHGGAAQDEAAARARRAAARREADAAADVDLAARLDRQRASGGAAVVVRGRHEQVRRLAPPAMYTSAAEIVRVAREAQRGAVSDVHVVVGDRSCERDRVGTQHDQISCLCAARARERGADKRCGCDEHGGESPEPRSGRSLQAVPPK